MVFILAFEDARALETQTVGSKFAALARAAREGFAVPESAAIVIQAHAHFLATGGWPDGLREEVIGLQGAISGAIGGGVAGIGGVDIGSRLLRASANIAGQSLLGAATGKGISSPLNWGVSLAEAAWGQKFEGTGLFTAADVLASSAAPGIAGDWNSIAQIAASSLGSIAANGVIDWVKQRRLIKQQVREEAREFADRADLAYLTHGVRCRRRRKSLSLGLVLMSSKTGSITRARRDCWAHGRVASMEMQRRAERYAEFAGNVKTRSRQMALRHVLDGDEAPDVTQIVRDRVESTSGAAHVWGLANEDVAEPRNAFAERDAQIELDRIQDRDLSVRQVDINGAFPVSQTITCTANVALNSNGKHLIVGAAARAPASASAAGVTGVSAVALCRLWRQGSVDTLVGDVCPTDVGVHIEWDRPGSRQMYVK